MPELSAKIAEVLSKSEIVINIGEDHGVEQGNTVEVNREIEIFDPDSMESLGSIKRTVLALRVVEVQSRLSIARIPAKSMLSAALGQREKEISGAAEVDSTRVSLSKGDEVAVFVASKEPESLFGDIIDDVGSNQ